MADKDKSFRIEIELVDNIESALHITQRILRELLNLTNIETLENYSLRDSKYNTLFTFYPHHDLKAQLETYREERRKEYEPNPSIPEPTDEESELIPVIDESN